MVSAHTMTRDLADARTDAERGATPSRIAQRMYEDLMFLPPPLRREHLMTLDVGDLTHLTRAVTRAAGTPFGMWVDDPIGFVVDVLGDAVWSRQGLVLESVVHHKRTAVPSAVGMGKCVYDKCVIVLANGEVVEAGDLVGRDDFEVMAWAEDGTQTPRRARAEWNAVETVYRVTTRSGREVIRNAAHPLWAATKVVYGDGDRLYAAPAHGGGTRRPVPEVRGWTAVGNLTAGDLVLVPEKHHAEGTERVKPWAPRLMGYLLGDGGTSQPSQITFTQQDGPALDDMRALLAEVDSELVPMSHEYHYRVRARGTRGARQRAHATSATGVAPWAPVCDLVAEWGMRGHTARTKRFPTQAWTMPNDQLADMLGALFACDGWVYHSTTTRPNGNPRDVFEVGITLASERMIRDVETAMLRLGIVGNVTARTPRLNGKTFRAWSWTCRNADAVQRLADVITIPGKDDRVQALAAHLRASPRRPFTWQHRNAPPGYRWDVVKSVDALPEPGRTVAIEVDEDHTFVSTMVEHNSHIAARATLWRSLVYPIGTSLTVTTAPRWRQVRRLLWPHIRAAAAKAKLPVVVDSMQMKAMSSAGKLTDIAYGFAAPDTDESAMQGIHHPKLFIVIDEAGGLSRVVGQATRGILTGDDTRMLAIGNPPSDDEGSWFETLCTTDGVNVVALSAYDSPAVTGEYVRCRACPPEMPPHGIGTHLNDREWIEGTIAEHGADAPYVIAKVNARFPKGGSARALPSTWIDLAAETTDDHIADGVRLADLGLDDETEPSKVRMGDWIRLGVDVAADGGDEFAIARAVGDVVSEQHASAGAENANPTDVAGVVLRHIRRAERLRQRLGTVEPVRVKIDAVGVGWGVTGILNAWKSEGLHDAEIVSVVVSEGTNRPDDPNSDMRPWRKRDEMWLATRAVLRPFTVTDGDPGRPHADKRSRLRLRVSDKTLAQLRNPKYGTNASGYTVIESKKSLKERGLTSPDRGESVLLAVYEPAPEPRKGTDFRIIG